MAEYTNKDAKGAENGSLFSNHSVRGNWFRHLLLYSSAVRRQLDRWALHYRVSRLNVILSATFRSEQSSFLWSNKHLLRNIWKMSKFRIHKLTSFWWMVPISGRLELVCHHSKSYVYSKLSIRMMTLLNSRTRNTSSHTKFESKAF